MKKLIIFCCFLFLLTISKSQTNDDSLFIEYRTTIPGIQYKAGTLHEIFLGSHWRDIWITPVRAPVIDLDKYGGGLTPVKTGSGLQTLSLTFKGGDGKEHKFRSLDKDPKKMPSSGIPMAKFISRDQVSRMFPYASLVAGYMLKETGVLNPDHTLVILPNDPALGEYRSEYANLIGIMEIVPDEKNIEGAERVINSVKLFDRLNEKHEELVDEREFLKARLMDVFMGDRDRHKGQWKWVGFKQDGKIIYKPFSTDRDQAFAKLDGFFPWLATNYFPQLNHFGKNYPPVRNITWDARYLDQRFLSFLSKRDWDEVTAQVHAKLTNELIENSVKQLPPEVYNMAKDELQTKLKSRRDQLKEFSNEYYEYVNSVVDIYTTDKDDYVEIRIFQNERTEISIYKGATEPAGDGNREPLRSKIFDNTLTNEIRIYLQDGDDEVKIFNGTSIPKLRIIGGKGKDIIVNNSDETVYLYDDGDKTKIKGDVSWNDDEYIVSYEKKQKEYNQKKNNLSKEQKDEFEEKIGDLRYDPALPPDKFSSTAIYPSLDYNAEVGLSIGVTLSHKHYGFRMDPYLYKLSITPDYTTSRPNFTGIGLDLNAELLGVIKNASLNFNLRKSGIEIINYFGQGNNTTFNQTLYDNRYYKVEHDVYSISPSLAFPYDSKHKVTVGATVKYFDLKQKVQTFVYDAGPYGSNNFSLVSGSLGAELDGRDHESSPYKGFYVNVAGSYYPKIFTNQKQFSKIKGDIRAYLGHKTNISLALRLKGEKIFGGSYPFFESAFLGGSKSLRGFSRERFAGDGSLLGTAELRWNLLKLKFLFVESIGVFGFGESGRVFLDGEDSKTWHVSYGGGLFIHFVKRHLTLKFTGASSKEHDFKFYLNTGFVF